MPIIPTVYMNYLKLFLIKYNIWPRWLFFWEIYAKIWFYMISFYVPLMFFVTLKIVQSIKKPTHWSPLIVKNVARHRHDPFDKTLFYWETDDPLSDP